MIAVSDPNWLSKPTRCFEIDTNWSCTVTVEQVEDGALVSILNPEFMVQMPQFADNPVLPEVSAKAGALLKKAADSLA